MKKSLQLLGCAVTLLFLAGCFSTKAHSVLDKSLMGQPLSPYTGAHAKIALNDFELKTSGIDAQAGLALKEYLISILNTTKRFVVVVPQEADLIITVGVIEFIPESSGGKSGLAGGGSSASSFMGGLLGEVLNKANMQLSLRIIDRVSSTVLSSRDIQSQAVENPGKKTKTPRDKVFKAGLSEYAGKPMGKVIHDCLIEAGRYIAQNVPLSYYNTPR
ncbi:MAG: CsgG/HfaB family protein [Candidatus Omnitrophica bacterium]|nr:CsgG/HfaB family protein [Candidatus Omnitrophota bacterium]